MAKGIFTHYKGTFYRTPCEIKGYKPHPIMITIIRFSETYNYSKEQLQTLLRDGHLFGKTFKKNMWVCPCPTSHIWTPEIIEQFWTRV
jgi:hypothetical protein